MSDSVHTDLALEAREALLHASPGEPDGIVFEEERIGSFQTLVSTVRVLTAAGEQSVGKPIGTYITLENPLLRQNVLEAHEEITDLLCQTLHRLFPLKKKDRVLIVGLGNADETADALGPLCVSGLLVTRHLSGILPHELEGRLRSVCALAPGVMGQTGIETLEIIQGIQQKVGADAILLIDALAAGNTQRINATIQLTDTGVCPGSGIGNRRQALSPKTLGVPVAAIGIPTVVDARTIIREAVPEAPSERLSSIDSLYVTPKDMDAVAKRLARILSDGLNRYLHALSPDEFRTYLY